MAVLDILQFGDDILREKSTEVADFNEELWELLDDMAETMYEAGGVGLAAPQVGVLKRVVVIGHRRRPRPAGAYKSRDSCNKGKAARA